MSRVFLPQLLTAIGVKVRLIVSEFVQLGSLASILCQK